MYGRKDFAKAIGQKFYPPNGINLTMEMYLGFTTPEVDKEYERLINIEAVI